MTQTKTKFDQRVWREANKEDIKKKQAEHYESNKEKYKQLAAEYYENNKDAILASMLQKRKTDLKYIQSTMVSRCRRRDKSQGRVPNIDLKYVRSIWPEDNCCPVFKTPFTIGNDTVRTNASIDRIDSSMGYVKGNVTIVSHRANTIKNDATLQELEAVVAFLQSIQ